MRENEREDHANEIAELEKSHNLNLQELDKEIDKLVKENERLREEMVKVQQNATKRIANVKSILAGHLAKSSTDGVIKKDYLTPFRITIAYVNGHRVKTYSILIPVPDGESNEEEVEQQVSEHLQVKKEVSLNILELVSVSSHASGWVAVIRETYR